MLAALAAAAVCAVSPSNAAGSTTVCSSVLCTGVCMMKPSSTALFGSASCGCNCTPSCTDSSPERLGAILSSPSATGSVLASIASAARSWFLMAVAASVVLRCDAALSCCSPWAAGVIISTSNEVLVAVSVAEAESAVVVSWSDAVLSFAVVAVASKAVLLLPCFGALALRLAASWFKRAALSELSALSASAVAAAAAAASGWS